MSQIKRYSFESATLILIFKHVLLQCKLRQLSTGDILDLYIFPLKTDSCLLGLSKGLRSTCLREGSQ